MLHCAGLELAVSRLNDVDDNKGCAAAGSGGGSGGVGVSGVIHPSHIRTFFDNPTVSLCCCAVFHAGYVRGDIIMYF
jgi:hypothetical protein